MCINVYKQTTYLHILVEEKENRPELGPTKQHNTPSPRVTRILVPEKYRVMRKLC